MRIPDLTVIAMLAVLVLTPAAGGAAERSTHQSLEEIHAAVEQFVRLELDGPGTLSAVRIDRLDPRLRLTRCGQPLSVWKPSGYNSAGRLTVGVRCEAPKPWKLYVPVILERRLPVVVAAHPIATGQRLQAGDLRLAERNIATLRDDYFTDLAAAVGQESRQMMRAGEVLGQRAVRPARVVQRGQSLIIEASGGPISVRMRGEAMQDGRRGQRIRVRNLSSQRIIEARVIGPDRVRVIF